MWVSGNLKTALSAGLVRPCHESLFTMVPKAGSIILAYSAGLCPTVLLSQKVLQKEEWTVTYTQLSLIQAWEGKIWEGSKAVPEAHERPEEHLWSDVLEGGISSNSVLSVCFSGNFIQTSPKRAVPHFLIKNLYGRLFKIFACGSLPMSSSRRLNFDF